MPTLFARAERRRGAGDVVSRPEFEGTGLTVAAYRRWPRTAGRTGSTRVAAGMLAALAAGRGAGVRVPCRRGPGRAPIRARRHRSGARRGRCVDRLLSRLVEGLPADAALLVTADHGQLDIPPTGGSTSTPTPGCGPAWRVVAGEPRVRYLHTTGGASADVIAAWRGVLGDGGVGGYARGGGGDRLVRPRTRQAPGPDRRRRGDLP